MASRPLTTPRRYPSDSPNAVSFPRACAAEIQRILKYPRSARAVASRFPHAPDPKTISPSISRENSANNSSRSRRRRRRAHTSSGSTQLFREALPRHHLHHRPREHTEHGHPRVHDFRQHTVTSEHQQRIHAQRPPAADLLSSRIFSLAIIVLNASSPPRSRPAQSRSRSRSLSWPRSSPALARAARSRRPGRTPTPRPRPSILVRDDANWLRSGTRHPRFLRDCCRRARREARFFARAVTHRRVDARVVGVEAIILVVTWWGPATSPRPSARRVAPKRRRATRRGERPSRARRGGDGEERRGRRRRTRTRALEARLVESETLRDGMRDALATLKENADDGDGDGGRGRGASGGSRARR